MGYFFTNSDIQKITDALNSEPAVLEGSWTWHLKNKQNNLSLVLTLYGNAQLGNEAKGALVSIQTQQGYYELHDISAYLVFDPDEIIFVQSNGDMVSCILVGSESVCSVFSNIRKEILKSDFSELDPAVLMAAMQLSLTESVLDDNIE